MTKELVADITTFDDYLAQKCSLDAQNGDTAKKMADQGKLFLADPHSFQKENLNATPAYKAACLQWHLIRSGFDNGRPFAKGMFTLTGGNIKEVYDQLKAREENKPQIKNDFPWSNKADQSSGLKKTGYKLLGVFEHAKAFFKGLVGGDPNKDHAYSRSSSHYGKFISKDGHFGIDKGNDPLPLNFKTTAFGMIDKKGIPSLYIKPETEGADFNHTIETIKHGWNLVKSVLGYKEKVPGLPSCRESDLCFDTLEAVKTTIRDKLSNNQLNALDKLDEKLSKCKDFDGIIKLVNNKLGVKIQHNRELDQRIKKERENGDGNEIRFTVGEEGSLACDKKRASAPVNNQLKSEDTNKSEVGVKRTETHTLVVTPTASTPSGTSNKDKIKEFSESTTYLADTGRSLSDLSSKPLSVPTSTPKIKEDNAIEEVRKNNI